MKGLLDIGPAAVPALIDELDRTEREEPLRALAFVLRAIGDPRAVPALVRAIPKTLNKEMSRTQQRITLSDPELQQFMLDHSWFKIKTEPNSFIYDSSSGEILFALDVLLKKPPVDLEEYYFIPQEFYGDSARRQRLMRELYYNLAEGYAGWWRENWSKFVENKADAQLERTDSTLKAGYAKLMATPRPPILSANQVYQGLGGGNTLIDHWPSHGIWDLDTNRMQKIPVKFAEKFDGTPIAQEKLISTSQYGVDLNAAWFLHKPFDKEAEAPAATFPQWLADEGIDLVRVKVPTADGQFYYAFQPIGMKVWRTNGKWVSFVNHKVTENDSFASREEWKGLIGQIDEKTGLYDPALSAYFIFQTREGTWGSLDFSPEESGKATTTPSLTQPIGSAPLFLSYLRRPAGDGNF